jgi:hypothetical protein
MKTFLIAGFWKMYVARNDTRLTRVLSGSLNKLLLVIPAASNSHSAV